MANILILHPPIRHVSLALCLFGAFPSTHAFYIAVSLSSPPAHDVIDHGSNLISRVGPDKLVHGVKICATNKPLPAPQKRPRRLQRCLAYPAIPLSGMAS